MRFAIALAFFTFSALNCDLKGQDMQSYGIEGKAAPEWEIQYWLDEAGKETEWINLSDYKDKVRVVFAFQSWCPGCHSRGFPTLQAFFKEFSGNEEVQFLVVQTVFEGHHVNTKDRLQQTQKDYKLPIPFGQDMGSETRYPSVMRQFRTGGTPWFIVIDKAGKVVFNHFHIGVKEGIGMINDLLD